MLILWSEGTRLHLGGPGICPNLDCQPMLPSSPLSLEVETLNPGSRESSLCQRPAAACVCDSVFVLSAAVSRG